MKNKKIISIIMTVIVIVSLLSGCGNKSSSNDAKPSDNNKKYVIKMGYGTGPGHPIDLASKKFKEEVEKKSNGRIEVKLFPSAQLGSERQLIEGLQAGTIDMTPTTTGPMGLFDKSFFVFDLPYIFKNEAAADRVLDGEIGQKMLDEVSNIGLVGLAFWENGFREITNNKREITKPEDLNGIKLRTMENEVHMKYFKNLGATPTPLGFGEIYMACKNKTVDGQENPTSIIATNKFYEVQKYMTISDHVYSPVIVLFSKKVWDTYPEDLKKIIKDTAVELKDYERKAGRDKQEEYINTIKNGGTQVTVLTDEQKEAFRKEAEKIYPEFEEKIGKELLDKVRAEGWK